MTDIEKLQALNRQLVSALKTLIEVRPCQMAEVLPSDDLCWWLREFGEAERDRSPIVSYWQRFFEAADEIERLRELVKRLGGENE